MPVEVPGGAVKMRVTFIILMISEGYIGELHSATRGSSGKIILDFGLGNWEISFCSKNIKKNLNRVLHQLRFPNFPIQNSKILLTLSSPT
jgi:hypothetical protein